MKPGRAAGQVQDLTLNRSGSSRARSGRRFGVRLYRSADRLTRFGRAGNVTPGRVRPSWSG
jgi:hypothetical protein